MAFCAAGTNVAQAAGIVLSRVEVTGHRRLAAAVVLDSLGLAPGAAYDEGVGNAALKRLYATGQFSDARLDLKGTQLTVSVSEAPLIRAVRFEGNASIETKEIGAEAGLKPGMTYARDKAGAAKEKLMALYAKKGRNRTVIDVATAPADDGRVDVVFSIKEAEVSKIVRIAFVGNAAFSESQLKDVLASAESGWMDFFKSNVIYDKERVDLDRDLVTAHYLKRGYADARVVKVDAVLDPQAKGYVVTFTVEEGQPYRFGKVAVVSKIEGVDTAALGSALKTKRGETFNGYEVETSLEAVNARLVESGRPFLRAVAEPQRDPVTRTMGVTYRIEDGPHVYVERIDITGNTRTKSVVIRRELRFGEGDALNAVLTAKAKKRLKALGFFKSVEIRQTKGSADDKAVLTVVVEEQETAEVGFGVGYSENEGIMGDVSYEERNLMGNGQYVKVKLAGSETKMSGQLSFTEPHFLGTNLAAGFDLFYRDQNFTTQASYKSQKVGGDVRLGYALTDTLSGSVNYTFVRNTLYDVGPNASAAIKEAVPNGTSNTYNTSSIGYSLAYDTRDAKKNPTQGVYLSTAQDFAGVGGDVRFLRTVAEARGYIPLTKDITLAGRVAGGTIMGWGGDDVRLLDMFYKGSETVRGFALAGIGPRDMNSANRDALGGSMFYSTSVEARYPIPFVPESFGLRGAVFADAGSLWGAGTAAQKLPGLAGNTSAMRASVGTGVVWDSPIGPLRLDYAVPFLKQTRDKTQNLSFGLASGF